MHAYMHAGALTKGDRRAATGVEFSDFNYNTQHGRTALRLMCSSVAKVTSADVFFSPPCSTYVHPATAIKRCRPQESVGLSRCFS